MIEGADLRIPCVVGLNPLPKSPRKTEASTSTEPRCTLHGPELNNQYT